VEGWVKLHRQIVYSDIYHMPPLYLRVFERLIIEANHRDAIIPYNQGRKLIKRGERLTSVRQICNWVGWYERNVFRSPNPKTIQVILDWLETNNMINIYGSKGNRKETHYSVVNYDVYQSENDTKVTVTGEQRKQSLETNKNDKNIYSSSSCSRAGNVFQFYQENIGLISPFQTETLNSYIDDGLKPEVIIEAMKDSLGTDNKWKYLTSILNRCIEQQIYTFEQYEAAKVEHENKKNGTPRSKPQGQIKTWTEIKEEEFERAKRLAFDKLKAEGVKEVDV
jgi:DnaD/phage-associated family protein